MSNHYSPIRLRPFRREDRAVTVAWRNKPEIRDAVMGFRLPVTDVMEDRWYDRVLDGSDKSKIYFAIEDPKSETLVGFCSLTDVDYQSSHAQFGIMIGSTVHHGRGLGAAALSQTIDYGFDTLNLHRIYVVVRTGNEPALKMFRTAGFKDEGTLRHHNFIQGDYEDVIVLGLLHNERLQS